MGCDDETRITELRSDIIPRKDAAVQQILSQWQQQEQQQDTSQNLLELLTYMQQELAALQQELSSLEARKLQEQQQDEADAVSAQGQPKGEQQPSVIHLQILHRRHRIRNGKGTSSSDGSSSSSTSSSKTIETSSSQLDLARLEEQHAVKILKLLTTHDCEVPSEDQYEEAVMQLLALEPGDHVWLIAQSTAASAVKAAAVSSACFLLQVEAALIALAVIKQQLRNVALTRGLRLVVNNWARLGGWGVRLLWGQKPPPLMQPLLELGSMAQREMEK